MTPVNEKAEPVGPPDPGVPIDDGGSLAADREADAIVDGLAPIIPSDLLPQVEMIVHETVGQIAMHRSAPLPDPRELDAYRQIDPTFAERIMRMAEREQEQRHRLPTAVLEREFKLQSRGQDYALIAVVAILLFAAMLAFRGDTRMAGYVAIGTLASIVGIFVSGRAISARSKTPNEQIETEAD